ncbi:MAG: alpha/beta hydrolase fold domain-containing protein [Clostridia bacterium]|nr:alpha/beta hydrolase fold domain-containing protein [Clostridia bacterium]
MRPFTKFLRAQLGLIKPLLANTSLESIRKGQERIGRLMASSHKAQVVYDDFKIGNLDASIITPKDEVSNGIILYIHGGGYTCGDLDYAKGFGTMLSSKCGIKVMCVAYRLAPEHIFPTAIDDCLDAYGYLLSHGYAPNSIILCGESAGGGIIYSMCLKLKEKGRVVPAGIIAISPWTDLTASQSSYEEKKEIDPIMTGDKLKFYADCYLYGKNENIKKDTRPRVNSDKDEDFKIKSNPYASPAFADLSKMPPCLVFVGEDEIMLGDAKAVHEGVLAQGGESELCVAPHMWHGYLLYGLKDSEGDFSKIRKFIKDRLSLQKKLRWMRLDNAAKIYPAARRRNWSNVFRLSATLKERVDREVLQIALDVTVRRFPSIAVSLKTGFFWYYLEQIPSAPKIMDEKPYPLSRMIFDDIRKCAFRVIVYENRIAVEFFHALTDGNGGLVFLKTLIAEYLYQKYGIKVSAGDGILDRLEEPDERELEDSFLKNAGPVKMSRRDDTAFKLSGKIDLDGFKTNTTFILDSDEIIREAKKYGVTVTAYMTAVLMMATMRVQYKQVKNVKRHKPIKVLIPVNLRKMFSSSTLRNFVLYTTPSIDPRYGEYTFEEIAKSVYHQMCLNITPKKMGAMIATNVGDESAFIIKIAPLFLKNLVMKLVFNAVGEKKSCFTFSNLGLVKLPREMEEHVERLDFVLGVQSHAPYNTSLITYGGKMYFNVIRNIKEPLLERELYKVFKSLGIRPRAESNMRLEK